jgi:tetrahydromethanopterin S-methyltransferase subunit G
MDEKQFERMMKVLEDINREVKKTRSDSNQVVRNRRYAAGGIVKAPSPGETAGR